MSKNATSAANGESAGPSYFEQQRELILQEIGENLEQVLQNLNRLNRNLEGTIAVGNEFSTVEALWSHFEGVMAKEPTPNNAEKPTEGDGDQQTPASAARP
ncbi:MAG: hypothetical protein Q9162_000229 [Coniocarpon cinnabarinum]